MTECGWQGVKGTSPLRFAGETDLKRNCVNFCFVLGMICLMHFCFVLFVCCLFVCLFVCLFFVSSAG